MSALEQILYLISNTDSVKCVTAVAGVTGRRVMLANFASYYFSALVLEGIDCSTDATVFCCLLQGVYGTTR